MKFEDKSACESKEGGEHTSYEIASFPHWRHLPSIPGAKYKVDTSLNWQLGREVCVPTILPALEKWWGEKKTHHFGSQYKYKSGFQMFEIDIVIFL